MRSQDTGLVSQNNIISKHEVSKMCCLLHGIVVETKTESWTGPYLYSDYVEHKQVPCLNCFAKVPLLGNIAGIIRMALSIIHIVGHLLAACVTWDKGHLIHAAKGCTEFLRGLIESIPIVGQIFAQCYNPGHDWCFWNDPGFENGDPDYTPEQSASWWMIKIYNPQKPDYLDNGMSKWANFPKEYYYKA